MFVQHALKCCSYYGVHKSGEHRSYIVEPVYKREAHAITVVVSCVGSAAVFLMGVEYGTELLGTFGLGR
jgi:hypothetical protein